MRFEKWQGLGNDFVVLDELVAPEIAREVCDRRLGVGADGVLSVTRDGGWRMVVQNADGSRPEMCGNGLRCVAAYLAERAGTFDPLEIVTDAGPRRCEIQREPGGYAVTAAMGSGKIVGRFEHGPRHFVQIDVGNPHAVSFDQFDDAALDEVGPAIERATPGGVNVELCRFDGDVIDTIVWERGVGRTQACGTGACAVAIAAVHLGLAKAGHIGVRLPGGLLVIHVGPTGELRMRGPAKRVFTGEIL